MNRTEKHMLFVDAHRDDDDEDRSDADRVRVQGHGVRPVMGHGLARLLLAQTREGSAANRSLAHALAHQLHLWSKGTVAVPDGEMLRLLRAAACEVLDEAQDE